MKVKFKADYEETVNATGGGTGRSFKATVTGNTNYVTIKDGAQTLMKIHIDDVNRVVDLLVKTKEAVVKGEKIIKDIGTSVEDIYKISETYTDAEKDKDKKIK